MKIRVLRWSSLFALAAACGGRSTEVPNGESADETIAVARIGLGSSLPSCLESTAGAVYYVVADAQLVYCDGARYQDVELESELSWLVSAGTAAACAHGGSTLSTGPDTNGNGKLDQREIVASATACNGAPSPPLPTCSAHEVSTAAGCLCIAGYTRASATAPCTELPATPSKPTGEDQPCTTDADCAGFEASFCDNFVSLTCLVRGCSVVPDSCFAGKECCDLSAFGLPMTLCIAEGACQN